MDRSSWQRALLARIMATMVLVGLLEPRTGKAQEISAPAPPETAAQAKEPAPEGLTASRKIPALVKPAPAAEPTPPNKEEEAWGVGAHPIIGYEPESSLTVGAAAEFYVNAKDPDQRPDEYTLNVTYSLRKQGTVSLQSVKYFRGDDRQLQGDLVFTKTPSSFFGIGPDTSESAEEEFEQLGIHPTLAFLVKVAPGLSIGPEYDFFYSDISEEPTGALASQQITGHGLTHESGIGFLASYDTTNRKLYKTTGTRLELRSGIYTSLLGSSHTFGTSSLDLRRFFSLPWNLVLAFHVALRSTYGEVPFFYLNTLGSKRLLRGYSGERYLANHFIGGQVELRYPIFWRFGGTAFFGAAEVQERFADFGTIIRAAGGLGLRLALNRSQTINLRFDLTCNSDGELEKYIKLGEAF